MVDNIELNTMAGGETVATDDDGSSQHQYVKVEFGADNTQTKVTTTEGLPIQNDDTDLSVAQSTSSNLKNEPAGNVAHDSVDSGNPIKLGAKVKAQDGTDPGSVAEDDRTDLYADENGRIYVNTAHPNLWKATDNQSTAQTNTELKATPGANLSLYITDIIISNGATEGNVKIVENTGTPVDIVEVMYFAANGGAVINFSTPIKITANTNVGYTSVDVTTHSVTLNGYIAP